MQTLYKELSAHYADIVSINTDTEAEVKMLDGIFQQLGIKSVLDIACGVGRHAVPLTGLGYKVVGIDYSESQIRNAVGSTTFVVANANTNVFKPESFDAAICMWSTIGEEPIDYRVVIRNGLKWLKPGGIFLIDNNDWKITSEWKTRKHSDVINGKTIEIRLLDKFTPKYRIRYIHRTINGKGSEDLCLTRIKTAEEWEKEFIQAGFHSTKSFHYQHSKKRVCIIAKKQSNA